MAYEKLGFLFIVFGACDCEFCDFGVDGGLFDGVLLDGGLNTIFAGFIVVALECT